MKLTVINWLRDASVTLIGRSIEIIFRIVLFLLPLGVYLFIMQYREKASTIRNISVYTNDESRWQHVFPGFILVSVDHGSFKRSISRIKGNIQNWVATNKYLIGVLFMVAVVLLMLLNEVK